MRRRAIHRVGLLLGVVLSVVVGVLVTTVPAQASARPADGTDDCATQAARALLSPYSGMWTDGYLAYADPWAKPKIPCAADGQPLSLGAPFGVYEEEPGQLLPPSLWRFGSACHWWDNACLDGFQRCGIAGPYSCPDPALQQPYLASSDPSNPYLVQPLNQGSTTFAPLYATTPDTPPTVSATTPQSNTFAPLYATTPDTPPTVSSSTPDSSSAPVQVPSSPDPVQAPSLPTVPGVGQLPGQSDSSGSSGSYSSSGQSDSSSSSSQSDSSSSSSSSGSSGQLELPSPSDSSSSSGSSGSSGQVELPSQPELPQVQSVDPGSSSSSDSGSGSSSFGSSSSGSSGSSGLGSVLSGQ